MHAVAEAGCNKRESMGRRGFCEFFLSTRCVQHTQQPPRCVRTVGASAATGIPAHWFPHGPRTRAQAKRRHWHSDSERNGHTSDSQRRIVALREAVPRAARGVRVTVYCVVYMLLLSASVACSVRAACCMPGPTPARGQAGGFTAATPPRPQPRPDPASGTAGGTRHQGSTSPCPRVFLFH